jgi:hypothetical protein
METTIYIMVFLISFGVSLLGAYTKGNKDGKKDMLDILRDKNIISSDIYVKVLKILNS